MRTFTLKGLFLTAVFMVLGCLAIHAADGDLITKQITIKLEEAGTLPSKIGDTKKYKITNLKIMGEINGTDLRFIRKMAGCNEEGRRTEGELATLDLSGSKIVKGGDIYFYSSYFYCYTSDDVIGAYAFYGCSSLTSLTLPSNVTKIGESAFEGCSGLTSLTLPSSVTSIGSSAFHGCSGLTSLTLPSSVTSIGWSAFSGCSGLTSLTLPSSVTEIGAYAFYGCSSLASLTLPSSVTEIGEFAFEGCSSLTSLTLPSSVTEIGESAFEGCSSLTSLTLPSSVTSIGSSAFYGCSGLTSIYVSWESPLSIDAYTFKDANTEKCILYVPKGTYDDYWLSNWGIFANIVEYDATGIDHITTSGEAKEISRYAADGQRLEVPAKGLNIVKYSDGSVKKVVVQ
nr:leucine-rich repeat domain-containing protein [Prevotella sp.]